MGTLLSGRLGIAITALGICVLTAACGANGQSPSARGSSSIIDGEDVSGVTLQFADQGSYFKSLLEFSHQLSDLPYKVTFSNFPGNKESLEALHAGAVDVATAGQTGLVNAFASGSAKFTAIAKNAQSDNEHSGYAILAPKDSSIKEVADLRIDCRGYAWKSAVCVGPDPSLRWDDRERHQDGTA